MDFDVVIVGGGLAGLALAVALRDSRLAVALVEGRAPLALTGWDSRIYAISPANARFLDSIGVWRHLNVERMLAVQAMEIQGGTDDGMGRLDFSAYDSGVTELAWIVEQSLMQRELWESAKRQANLELVYPGRPATLEMTESHRSVTLTDGRRLSTRLIVAADGADSWTRAAVGIEVSFKPYGQLGVVANFCSEKSHHGTAFQWFRDDGILAWLPLPGNQISMVWSTGHAHAADLLALAADDLARRVETAGNGRLGKLELMTPAAGFPLRLMRAPMMVLPRFALIGDAAHAIHPLSGHGINLGFQDAAALAAVLNDKPDYIDSGDFSLLRIYERTRKEEVVALQGVTDGLQQLFGSTAAPLTALRSFGLNLTNHLPVVKDALVRYALAS
jgi:ubiquinone biosynthesis UbiH/UbiF/VisC/COQ6 family hydroxylase